ncbi:MgtC/SapB family protein [Aquabacterium sp.]|uniref:MgtC/SapB family protein n=1 Tax=Aquabacterium sp. TaxID=1872578 RepID=UPI0035C6F77C
MNGPLGLGEAETALIVALGTGLLVGVERERRKGDGPERAAAGLRTFTVVALVGAVSQIVSPWLAAVALAGVVGLAALSYVRNRSDDPGLTTELALVATALIGMLALSRPALAAACGVVLAGLLAARQMLHRFATHWLSEAELHDALLLSALALVLLPLLPGAPLPWLGHLSPQRVLLLVVVLLGMQASGHVAQRLLGERVGLALSGLLGGFVSSTATVSAMGALARDGQAPFRLAWSAAVLSTAATWLQLPVLASVVSPTLAGLVWPWALLGVGSPLILGGIAWWRGRNDVGARSQEDHPGSLAGRRVLRLREALVVTGLLVGAALLVTAAERYGAQGLMVVTAVAAVADAHAPVASLLAATGAGELSPHHLLTGILVAISVNSVTRSAAASGAGGLRFGTGVAVALVVNLLVAWGGAYWLGWLGPA